MHPPYPSLPIGVLLSISIAGLAFIIAKISRASQIYCIPPLSPFTITTLELDSNLSNGRTKCFQVTNGIFSELLSQVPQTKKVQYLDGWVIPGVIDSHGHMMQYGEMLESVNLYESKNVTDMRERIKNYLKTRSGEGWGSKDKWIRGVGWDQKFFDGIMPTASDVSDDPELSGLYMSLDRVDVHCSLVSRKVLELLHPIPNAPDGGMIIDDPGPGVFCDNAMDIVLAKAPKPDREQKRRWLRSAMSELNKVGITGVGDAGMRYDDISILEEMADNGEMSLRTNVMLECKERNTFCPEEASNLRILNEDLSNHMLMLGGVKLFSDGALGSWGAALLQPYFDRPDMSGVMLINETELTKVVKKWYDFGFQVNIHAIGDRANRAAVDAFEGVLGPDCIQCNNRRLRIEHAQIIHPDDQERIRRMGIIPSIQPTHATSDMSYALSRLGSERLKDSAYRMKSLFSSSTPPTSPVLGSDFPVEPSNPFHGMYAAVTRISPNNANPSEIEGWHMEEALNIKEAIHGFTFNAGYGWKKEDKMGSIEVGKWADWVVIDRDIWADRSGKGLKDVVVREVWVAGKRVFVKSGSH